MAVAAEGYTTMQIQIVGNGGCLNVGLPYNSFVIDKDFLVEAPPDVVPSLKMLNLDVGLISTVFISHLHGDHTFGFPFFAISRWNQLKSLENPKPIRIISVAGIGQHLMDLIHMAFGRSHPCYAWTEANSKFIEIDDTCCLSYSSYQLKFFRLDHIDPTFGLQICGGKRILVTYIADTRWCDEVEQVLGEKPKVVLMDMNGGPVHMSYEEIRDKGLPISGEDTSIYGIHLNSPIDTDDSRIFCTTQGDIIEVE